jgi:tRNA modification GTPase
VDIQLISRESPGRRDSLLASGGLDTIVAVATPPGRGGIGIVRVSGPKVPELAPMILGKLPLPRQAIWARFRDGRGEPIDEGLALLFPAPHSYTGEHVLELQGHGGPLVIEALLARVVELGARRALPGEFTQRAFLNDKLDLAQAEAVADLIDAGSREAARAAMRSLQGELSAQVHSLVESVTELRVYVEAAIDFPEEEIDFLSGKELSNRLAALEQRFEALAHAARQGQLLRDGMSVVIAGRPNAGKSSLLNRLAGYDAAIVTPIPGTTRDVVRERIHLDGMPLHILDTAGLREGGDRIEQEGIRRAEAEMQRADRLLFVIDSAADPEGGAFIEEQGRLPTQIPVTLVFNKRDLAKGPLPDRPMEYPRIGLSAHTGEGIDDLRTHLKSLAGYQTVEAGIISARQRHLESLSRARRHTQEAVRQLERRAGELVAEELRAAQQALGEITGEVTTEDLLGRIFSSFCVGK